MLAFRYVFKDFEKEEFTFKIWTLEQLEQGIYKTFTQTERNSNLDKHSVDLMLPFCDEFGLNIFVNDKIITKDKQIFFVGYSTKEGFYLYNKKEKIVSVLIINNLDLIEDCEIIGNTYISE